MTRAVILIMSTTLVLGALVTLISLYVAIAVLIVSGSWGAFINVLAVGAIPAIALITLLLIPSKYYEEVI